MRTSAVSFAVLFAFACSNPAPAFAQRKSEPLADQVKRAIERGVSYLRQKQAGNDSWEVSIGNAEYPGGGTSLALLALLNSGVRVEDDMIQRGLRNLRTVNSKQTYVKALQTMVYAEAGLTEDKDRIAQNVKWLIDTRIKRDDGLYVWSYGDKGGRGDNSNTQYALLALYAAHASGVKVPDDVWQAVREYYLKTQKNGGWIYTVDPPDPATLTMTVAGLCGLIMADLALTSEPKLDATGRPENCREYRDGPAIEQAAAWVSEPRNFGLEMRTSTLHTYYNMYGIERVGRLSGHRFIAGRDWYREGCDFLVRQQMQEGSWHLRVGVSQADVISTSFALLFLSKGRTPVLISKLVHGNWRGGLDPRRGDDLDWNRHRHDVRHLTDFSRKTLFNKNIPLAWQVFDVARGAGGGTAEELEEVTSDLLQSPILYISGQESPLQRFTGTECDVLKRYIENGGFVLAEACHDSPAFATGFKQLCRRLWPQNELTPLGPGHPIWTARFPVSPKNFQLEGIQMGCKTVLVFSPQGLSCMWDWNDQNRELGKTAFELGANIVAYATGMEPPKPRLTRVEITRDREPRNIERGFLKVAQLKHRGDWQPAPNAMRNLMSYLHTLAGIDVVLKTETMPPYENAMRDFKFVYMHGRGSFEYQGEELENIKKNLGFNLENGGLLLADACCGSEVFDKSFRKFVKELFPKHELEQVPLDDFLFSKELNKTEALTNMNIRYRRERGGDYRNLPPFLEGIKVNNRWVVLYSKYDLGCALERHSASDCIGYDHESAKRIAGAAVLYLFEP